MEAAKAYLLTVQAGSWSRNDRKVLMELLMTPDELCRERQRKQRMVEVSRAYRDAHKDDAEFKAKRNKATIAANKKRYAEDPEFRKVVSEKTRAYRERKKTDMEPLS